MPIIRSRAEPLIRQRPLASGASLPPGFARLGAVSRIPGPPMTKSFFTRHRRLLGASFIFLLLAAAGGYHLAQRPQPLPADDASAAMLAELRQDSGPWNQHRADLSTLVGDMRDGRIASA